MCIVQLLYSDIYNINNNKITTNITKVTAISGFCMFNILNKMSLHDVTE